MKILITGNLGYIGTNLAKYLLLKGFSVKGLDSGLFRECLIDNHSDIATSLKDIRDVERSDFDSVDSIIHLAALSNDPLGEFDESLTFKINHHAAVRTAEIAKSAGVKRFIFVSTQSIYGISKSDAELNEDFSDINPITAYAISKWRAEQEIKEIASPNFNVIILRPSTVFGWSPRLRTDIVFNNLVANGFFKNKIEIHSDGLPWRPVIHVRDMCEAINLALNSKLKIEVFNVGMIGGNFRIKELAEIAARSLSNIPIYYNTENITDSRSYKVNFDKARSMLGFEADVSLESGGLEIIKKLNELKDTQRNDFWRKTNRLTNLNYLIINGMVDDEFRLK